MMRNAFFAVLLGLFVACSQSESTGFGSSEEGQTGGGSSSSTSAGSSGSTSGTGGMGGVGGVGGVCDDAAECGTFDSACTGCAVSATCAEVYDGCFGDATCLEFNKCWAGCNGDVMCRSACTESNPIGAERYQALLTCIVCQVCLGSCKDSEFATTCP
ncbi:MAG TPA: hypothetical protein PK156_25975 [Polyangium sp.]|nr:hypothetical protein [Polyangium sp.]